MVDPISKEPKSTAPLSQPEINLPPPPRLSKKQSESKGEKAETPEEKLARLKAKYPVRKQMGKTWTPLVSLIDAKAAPGSAAADAKPIKPAGRKLVDCSNVERVLNDWLSTATLRNLRDNQAEEDEAARRKDETDMVVEPVRERRDLTDYEQAVANFYRGDRVAVKAPDDEQPIQVALYSYRLHIGRFFYCL